MSDNWYEFRVLNDSGDNSSECAGTVALIEGSRELFCQPCSIRQEDDTVVFGMVKMNNYGLRFCDCYGSQGITGQDLYSKSNYPKSSFTVNFGGGMRSFFALSEQVVIERFAEAVKGRDFEKGLKNGFQSLLTPINFSDYNTNRQNGVDMALRTQFCYKVFGLDYWKLVLKPLLPALDSYLAKAEPRWNNVADEAKIQAYDLFTEEFHWIVGLLLREHSKQQEAPDPFVPLDEYVNIYSQIIRTTVLLLFSEINLRDTLFEKYLGRMKY